jgi:hypothetical protein
VQNVAAPSVAVLADVGLALLIAASALGELRGR